MTERIPIVSDHVWGKRRVGYRGLDALELSREAWDEVHAEIEASVNHRRLRKNEEIGHLEYCPDDGSIVGWEIDDRVTN